MDNLELVCFKIISSVGSAKSMYIEAVEEAKQGNYDRALELIEEGREIFTEGHHAHGDLIQQEATGNGAPINLLLMHAEDQLMNAETIKIMAEELIEVYKRMNK